MSLHAMIIPACENMLRNLAGELAKSAGWARENGMLESELLAKRLAPDMFPLVTQVNFTCHQAREAIARLKGETVPAMPEEQSLSGLSGLIEDTLNLLSETSPADIDGAAEKTIRLDLPNGIAFEMTGFEYVRDWATAQFYFHRMTAYAILRQTGIPLGKADYVAHALKYIKAK